VHVRPPTGAYLAHLSRLRGAERREEAAAEHDGGEERRFGTEARRSLAEAARQRPDGLNSGGDAVHGVL
jgi:hypothetical protein